MAEENANNVRKELRKYLTHQFSQAELRIICFDLGIDDEKFSGQKDLMVIDLLRYLIRKEKLHLLEKWLSEDGYKKGEMMAALLAATPMLHMIYVPSINYAQFAISFYLKISSSIKLIARSLLLREQETEIDVAYIEQLVADFDNDPENQ